MFLTTLLTLSMAAGGAASDHATHTQTAASGGYSRLADAGNPRAKAVTGALLVQKGDVGAAMRYLPDAAEAGDTEAQMLLGDLYVSGRGVVRDGARAAHFYALAVGQSAEAQWKLGALFQEGDGVPQSQEIAASMYRRAAEQGYADAQNSLAAMYLGGLGVKQNMTEALKWFRKAAESGCADAQLNMASLYTQGVGVSQDFDEARAWAEKARQTKSKKAEALLAEIEKARAEAKGVSN